MQGSRETIFAGGRREGERDPNLSTQNSKPAKFTELIPIQAKDRKKRYSRKLVGFTDCEYGLGVQCTHNFGVRSRTNKCRIIGGSKQGSRRSFGLFAKPRTQPVKLENTIKLESQYS